MNLIDKSQFPFFFKFFIHRGLFYPHRQYPFGHILLAIFLAPFMLLMISEMKSDFPEYHFLIYIIPITLLFAIDLWFAYRIYHLSIELSGNEVTVHFKGRESETYRLPNELLSAGQYNEKGEFIFLRFKKSFLIKDYPFENPKYFAILSKFLKDNRVKLEVDCGVKNHNKSR